jgi:hypothetical protein
MRFRMFLVSAVVAPLLAAAGQPLRLQPSTPWIVDYAEQSCRLIRKFGGGDTETLLLFESEAPDEMDVLLVGRPLRSSGDEVPARFLPVQGKPDMGRPVTSTDNGEPGILFSRVRLLPDEAVAKLQARSELRKTQPHVRPPASDLAEEFQLRAARRDFATKATQLEIDGRRGRPVILETGSMGPAINRFDQCSRDSLRDWGADPDLEDKIVRPVWLENHDTVLTPEDYPKSMLYAGQQSEVKVRVLVDASGRVTKCTSLSHFKLPEFTDLVCKKMTRNGRFEPAELSDGTRVASYYTVHINFRIRG